MSEMTEKPAAENSDEDRASLKSNGKTPTNGSVKDALGMIQTFRRSFRKGSKVASSKAKDGPQPPPSPSLSSGSPVTSPTKEKKDEETAVSTSQKSKGLTRSKTDPNMARLGETLLKRGESIRRSLPFGKKKPLVPVTEGSLEEQSEDKDKDKKEEEEEEVVEEMKEEYTLPEIPPVPMSVMQINKLIVEEALEEAYVNLLALRLEFQQERERCGDQSSMELAKKEKDLNLLYGELRKKINTIVCDSNKPPLDFVARIIQEEERRAEEPGGYPGSWMEAWREAVEERARAKVESVPLQPKEQNVSWLAVHLGLLGQAIVEDLGNMKKPLRQSYPPSFKAFSTYVSSYHRMVGRHLKRLETQATELTQVYALLNWILNSYKSERIMGSPSLQPYTKDESVDLQLEDDLLRQLRDKYCSTLKEDMKASLDRVTQIQIEDVWTDRQNPSKEEDFLSSDIPMDIWTYIKSNVKNSRDIDAQLAKRVTSTCLEELRHFPKRFETEFRRHCSALRPQPLWTKYQITYINSFTALQQHMEEYGESCPAEVEGFRKEVKWLIVRLMQDLEDQFKDDTQISLRRMMTRKWLTSDEDFDQLQNHLERLQQHCSMMRPPHVQEFASRLHYHVVKEYVSQLMKTNYSCKNRKHERAASKIREQWDELRDLFVEMGSTHEWLHPVGDDLCNIITQRNKTDIKNQLQPIVEHYPDFSKKHLVAVLYFRGLKRGREHQQILQKLSELKKKRGNDGGNKSRVLFSDMPVTTNTDCLTNLPFSCLNFLLPNN